MLLFGSMAMVGEAYLRDKNTCARTSTENVGGAYMRDLTFYLENTPPLPGPRLDVDIDRFSIDTINLY